MMTEESHAVKNAQAVLANIRELLAAMDEAEETGEPVDFDGDALTAEQLDERAHDLPLGLEVRDGWRVPGGETDPEEYLILMSTGGPACRIIGGLDRRGEPESARIEYQDWNTPWTPLDIDRDDEGVLAEFARMFYFGE